MCLARLVEINAEQSSPPTLAEVVQELSGAFSAHNAATRVGDGQIYKGCSYNVIAVGTCSRRHQELKDAEFDGTVGLHALLEPTCHGGALGNR